MINLIKSNYNLTVNSVTPAPRGFWAETYYLDTDRGRFFLKLHKGYPWRDELTESLRVQAQLAERVDFIPRPLQTCAGGYYTEHDGGVAVVYAFVDGETHIERDACMIMQIMADIYKSDIPCSNEYKYKLYAADIVESIKDGSLAVKSSALKGYLGRNRGIYLSRFDEYARLYEYAKSCNGRKFLTHGDLAKNLMRGADGKIFVIDWDRIRTGTPELDLSEFAGADTDIGELDKIAEAAGLDWRFDHRLHNYFVLNRLYYNLRNLTASDSDTLTEENVGGYQSYLDGLKGKLL